MRRVVALSVLLYVVCHIADSFDRSGLKPALLTWPNHLQAITNLKPIYKYNNPTLMLEAPWPGQVLGHRPFWNDIRDMFIRLLDYSPLVTRSAAECYFPSTRTDKYAF